MYEYPAKDAFTHILVFDQPGIIADYRRKICNHPHLQNCTLMEDVRNEKHTYTHIHTTYTLQRVHPLSCLAL